MPRVVLALTTRKAEHAVLVEQVGDTPAGAKRQYRLLVGAQQRGIVRGRRSSCAQSLHAQSLRKTNVHDATEASPLGREHAMAGT